MLRPSRIGLVVGPAVALLAVGAAIAWLRGGDVTASECADYPFTSISCSLYQAGGGRITGADSETLASVPVSREQALAEARRLEPQDEILEVELVWAWSSESTDPASDRQLLWAVSVEPANGIYISGGAIFMKEHSTLRAPGDTRPLTPEEQRIVQEAGAREMQALRDAIQESYRLVYIDPNTGAYRGSAEGAR
jgi:hypothetical protein